MPDVDGPASFCGSINITDPSDEGAEFSEVIKFVVEVCAASNEK